METRTSVGSSPRCGMYGQDEVRSGAGSTVQRAQQTVSGESLAAGASVSVYHTALKTGTSYQSTTYVITSPQGLVRAFYQ